MVVGMVLAIVIAQRQLIEQRQFLKAKDLPVGDIPENCFIFDSILVRCENFALDTHW